MGDAALQAAFKAERPSSRSAAARAFQLFQRAAPVAGQQIVCCATLPCDLAQRFAKPSGAALQILAVIRREQPDVHIVDRFILDPPVRLLGLLTAVVRRMHIGQVNAFAAYILIAILLALVIRSGLR